MGSGVGSARTESIAQWWEGNFYPDAGEVIGWRETRVLRAGEEVSYPPAIVRTRTVAAGSAEPPSGPGESTRERASRRARTVLRRYATSNRLRYLWVLTFAPSGEEGLGEYDLARCKRRTALFVKRGLREALGYRGPYVIGWERHKSGAWHVNVLVGERLDHAAVRDEWGRGFVWVSRFRSRHGESQRDGARRAAAYVAKYVTKEFADLPPGVHRYEVAQGFAVRSVRVFALSASGVLWECDAGDVAHRFDAPAPESGRGPPIVWAAFAG